MTTIVPSKSPNPLRPLSLVISDGDDNPVHFAIDTSGHRAQINVDRTALLDAVRSEFGVLIIDKADLPEVEERSHYLFAGTTEVMGDLSPALLREKGLSYLALAEHVEAHPPVDEQQVEALVTLLNETSDGHAQSAPNIARRLIATGKVTVQS